MTGSATAGTARLGRFQAAWLGQPGNRRGVFWMLAGAIGFALFGEAPDLWSRAGAAVIVAATVYIARREASLGDAPVLAGKVGD